MRAGNITLTFAEGIRKDSGGTALSDGDLAGILKLAQDDESGTPIGFSASIDADKLVITIDPASDLPEGKVYVAISDGYFDTAGNRGLAAEATFTVDTSVPTVTIGGVPEAINAADAFTATFTFSEDVTGFDTDDVTVTGGSKGTFQGSGKSYTLAVTPRGTADVVVTVRANAATDGVNQGPAQAVAATARWDTTAPAAPTFDPASGAAVKDAGTDITITFAEALRKDANGTALENADLAAILTLKVDDDSGAAIGFAATIDDAKKVITLNPNADLAEGDVYVAISAEHWDAAGNQGALRSATFTVDTTAPAAPEFSPANAAIVSDASTNITITFAEALRKDANGTALENADLASILTLKATDDSGAPIDFAATIDQAKKVITLNPASDLDPGKVYVAISADHFDAAGNQGAQHTATFTVDTAAPTVTIGGVPEAINAVDAFTATFTFSEDVTGFATGDVTVAGGSKGTFRGSGKSYTLAVTPSGSEDVTVTVAQNAATDGANQGPPQAVAATARWDTTAPAAPTFSPENGAAVSNAATDITITFAEALRRDADGAAFTTEAHLKAILTLKTTNDTGTAIGFAATIDEAKKVITLNPNADLAEGDVYVAISAEHWDAAGNKGSQHTATFTVDTTAPAAPEFSPANAATVSDASTNITITFAEALRKDANGTALANADLAAILTLKVDDDSGAGIDFAATIDEAKKVITLNPASDLDPGKVYVAISADHFDAAGNQGAQHTATFTVDTAAPTVTIGGVPEAINAVDAFTATFTFSEDVTGFATGDVTVAGGSKGTFRGSGKSYTLVVTPSGSEDVTVTVAQNAATDGANQGPPQAVAATARWDTTAPAAPTFSPENGAAVSNAATDVTITFNEALRRDADGAAFTTEAHLKAILTLKTTNDTGTAIGFAATIDEAKKVITLDPNADLAEGDVYVAISAEHWDAAGNKGSQHTATFTVDTTAPAVTISGVPEAINAADAFTATFTFSEDVTGFATGDVTVAGGSKGTFRGSGKSYTLVVMPSGSEDVTVTVAQNAATGGANQGPPQAVAATARWDTTAPAAPTFRPENGAAVSNAGTDITITFNEALRKDANGTPLEDADLAAILTLKVGNDNTGTAIGFAATIDDAKKVITLNPNADLAEGDVYVAISAEHWDAAGNKGSQHTATFTVDTTAPAAPEFSPANAATVSDASTDITITFAEALRKDANGTPLANADLASHPDAEGGRQQRRRHRFRGHHRRGQEGHHPQPQRRPRRGRGLRRHQRRALGRRRQQGIPAQRHLHRRHHRPDGHDQRRAGGDQRDDRLHRDLHLLGGRDGLRDRRRDGDRRHEGDAPGQRQELLAGGDALRQRRRDGDGGAERGHRRRQPGPAPGGRGDGAVGHHGSGGAHFQTGPRRRGLQRRHRHHHHLRRGAPQGRQRHATRRRRPRRHPDARQEQRCRRRHRFRGHHR